MNAKKFNSAVVPSHFAAGGDSKRTSLWCDGKMMVGKGTVALYRAPIPAERQRVVLCVRKHWERVGQRPRKHLFVWGATSTGSFTVPQRLLSKVDVTHSDLAACG